MQLPVAGAACFILPAKALARRRLHLFFVLSSYENLLKQISLKHWGQASGSSPAAAGCRNK
jgi:hypothetical protein